MLELLSNYMKFMVLIAAVMASTRSASAEPKQGLSVAAGLTQPLLFQGANIEIAYKTGRMMYEFSNGFNLKLHKFESSLTSEEKDEKLKLTLPWTTGIAVGYFLTDTIALALEASAHRYDVEIPGGEKASYTTYSVGPGLFYTKHFGENFFIQPVLRYWPNVGSSEDGDKVGIKRANNSTYDHQVHEFGLFANIRAGWTF
ncbi:MAG: hypothetical protein LW875_03330 [Proteobacteria bacterium]|nr:hypothetical protein [Pseudomonadota bacterium]